METAVRQNEPLPDAEAKWTAKSSGSERLSASDFLAWSERQSSGRHELVDGKVVRMAAERSEHAVYKGCAYRALLSAAERTAPDLRVTVDGLGIVTGTGSVREPDVVVNAGPLTRGSLTAPNPFLVLEVSSPGSIRTDEDHKLIEYADITSIRHYLVAHPDNRSVIWFARTDTPDTFSTKVLSAGPMTFDPYDLTITVEEIFNDSAFE